MSADSALSPAAPSTPPQAVPCSNPTGPSSPELAEILAAIQAGDTAGADFARLKLPDSYLGLTVHADEAAVFEGLPTGEKDPRKSLHLDQVPLPELGPGEALIAVMASAINYNTVWSSIFEPVSTFAFLRKYGKLSELTRRHDLPYHVLGSDLAGVVLRTGPGVNKWKAGDEVVAHCLSVELEDAAGHNDTMLDPEQRIWGFETNFGGLAEAALVKTNQLMPKPDHLTWEEAASPGLVNSTAYRQLVSTNGAGMKQGDVVLIWGASGGLGSYATQMALNGGAIPVCVVSSPEKAKICRAMGAELIIDRAAEDYRFWSGEDTQDPKEWQRFGARIRELTGGEDPDIVFEHPGRETFGASVYVARRGGVIVTCASTSGFVHQYDNRYLWMNLKRIVGSHFANYREAWEANRLVARGMIHPTLSRSYPLGEAGQAVFDVHRNLHQGKVGVLCLAPEEGLGVRNGALREQHRSAIERFRNV
jgi:crotonyl-CoA reductase